MVALSNQAGGAGVVGGYYVALGGGDRLTLQPGLAIDASGRLLLLSSTVNLSIAQLIDQGRRLQASDADGGAGGDFGDCVDATAPPAVTTGPTDLYLVCLGHAEDFCGQEDVYGAICEPACARSAERPYVVEGIVVLVVPLSLTLPAPPKVPVAIGAEHLRSRAASAFFAREAAEVGSLISATGLTSGLFCLGSRMGGGAFVPVGVLDRAGGVTTFVDPWIARRERIETPPRRYWAWRMAMRPWDVFLAQVLQFQCQLPGALGGRGDTMPSDPCADKTRVFGEVEVAVRNAHMYLSAVADKLKDVALGADLAKSLQLGKVSEWFSGYGALAKKITDAQKVELAADRLLIRGGIVELPSAGYLPVVPTSTATLEKQVRDLMGEGVDLRFCVVRPDYVPHALETAHHMERISLLDGLADPAHKPEVDILVPDGELDAEASQVTGIAFDAALITTTTLLREGGGATGVITESPTREFPTRRFTAALAARGVARAELPATGGAAFYFAGTGKARSTEEKQQGSSGGILVERSSELSYELPEVQVSPYEETVAAAARRLIRQRLAERPIEQSDAIYEYRSDGLGAHYVDPAFSADAEAVWLSLAIEANPLAMDPGGATACSARMVLVIPSARPVVEEIAFSGELRVRASERGADGTIVRGVLRGDVRTRFTVGGHSKTNHQHVAVAVTLVQKGDGADGSVEVSLPLRGGARLSVKLVGRAQWTGSPIRAAASISEEVSDRGAVGERMTLREDPSVALPGSARRAQALRGLDILDAVLDEPGFRASAETALFPPPAPSGQQTFVRAHADWVLFQRRRNNSCACGDTTPRPALKVRTYRVYVVEEQLRREKNLVELTHEVRQPFLKNEIPRFGANAFQEVGLVDFEGGTDRMLTPAHTLLTQLRRVPHGSLVFYAAVASQGEAATDGDTLQAARLSAVEKSLSAELTLAEGPAVLDVLDAIPRSVSVANADGVMILLTSEARVVVAPPAQPVPTAPPTPAPAPPTAPAPKPAGAPRARSATAPGSGPAKKGPVKE